MSVLERDPVATARRLEEWLTEVGGFADVHVDDVSIPGSTGWSNETVLFDARWRDGDDLVARRLVARIAPAEYSVFPDDTFASQFAIMQALATHTDVPVAEVHWFEPSSDWFGKEFWIMARVDGDIATDTPHYAAAGWLHDATPADQERAWWAGIEAMAAVHRVDVATLGPIGVRDGAGSVAGSVAEQLDFCERFLTWAEDGTTFPLARQALDVVRLDAPADPAEGPALSWGDSRFSNLIFRDLEVAAVLDWEMASLGDPLLDVGWWLFADDALTQGMGAERLPGFPSAEATGARWSELTGRSADALGWYELLAAVRFATIMLRMGKLLHGMGLVPDTFPHDNLISQALDQRLRAWR